MKVRSLAYLFNSPFLTFTLLTVSFHSSHTRAPCRDRAADVPERP